MTMRGLTHFSAMRLSDGLVHKLQGGGVAMRDDDGRSLYDIHLVWCSDCEVATGELTDEAVTCQQCLNEYAQAMKSWGRED